MNPNVSAINPVAVRWPWQRATLVIGLSSLLLWGGIAAFAGVLS